MECRHISNWREFKITDFMTTEVTQILVLLFPQHLMSLTVNSTGYLGLTTHKTNEMDTQKLNITILLVNFLRDICSGYTKKIWFVKTSTSYKGEVSHDVPTWSLLNKHLTLLEHFFKCIPWLTSCSAHIVTFHCNNVNRLFQKDWDKINMRNTATLKCPDGEVLSNIL